jgi:hypothetical protein
MAVDSNMPYHRVNVQANNNDTIWNGAAWGAGAGVGALGVTYGATLHGAKGLDTLNWKAAGSKTTRTMTRNNKRAEANKSHLTPYGLESKIGGINNRAIAFSEGMGHVQNFNHSLFGSKKKMIGTAAVGLMGGMLAGGAIDYLNK